MTSTQRTQKVVVKPGYTKDWTEITVLSHDRCGDLASTTNVRSRDDCAFVDVAIEEYTGMSRRAKSTNVRLEEDAAKALYVMLAAKFAKAIENVKSN